MKAHDDQMRTEISFEVTIVQFVTESDPSPTENDIWIALDRYFHAHEEFDIESYHVTRAQ